eukprot:m.193637 g.193637  ORF g.193637 m.193637 type:complete len:90 (-) comp16783_c2_seq6:74-343(-)
MVEQLHSIMSDFADVCTLTAALYLLPLLTRILPLVQSDEEVTKVNISASGFDHDDKNNNQVLSFSLLLLLFILLYMDGYRFRTGGKSRK